MATERKACDNSNILLKKEKEKNPEERTLSKKKKSMLKETHTCMNTQKHTVYFNMLLVSKQHLVSLGEKTTYCS